MQNKIKEKFDFSIDYVKKLKERILKVESITKETEKDILEAIETQDIMIRYIINIFKTKCWLEKDERFKKLKDNIVSKLLEVQNLNIKQKKCISLSKEEIEKSMSLLRSFYDKNTKDKLTWLWNEEFTNNLLDILWSEEKNFHLIYLDMNNLKKVNDTYWHKTGDKLILEFARLLKLIFGEWEKTYIARIHWDEFNIISLEDKEIILKKLDKLKKWMENSHIDYTENNKKEKILVNSAYWYASSSEVNTIAQLIHTADKRMYENKIKMKEEDLWNK